MDLSVMNTDISFNILSRLPANLLVQLKMVSKGWRHLLADPDFMHSQTKVAEPISISGYFFQEKYMYSEIDVEKLSYIPLRSQEIKIYQNVLDFLPEKVTILGSSNGLICCRSCIPSHDPLIYICNPVNKQWIDVKWDRIQKRDYIAFFFNPAFGGTTGYKLVRVFEVDELTPGKEEFYFSFEIYDWERKVWVKSKEICHCEDSLCINKQAFVQGILYWLTDGNTLVMFDVENELSLLVLLPITSTGDKTPHICLGECNGELCCVVVSQEALMVWALEDHFGSKWDLRSFISFDVMEEKNQEYVWNLAEKVSSSVAVGEKVPWMQPLAFKDGMLFLRVSNYVYSFDINTWKMRFLCDVLDLGHECIVGPTVIPYSVSFAPVAN